MLCARAAWCVECRLCTLKCVVRASGMVRCAQALHIRVCCARERHGALCAGCVVFQFNKEVTSSCIIPDCVKRSRKRPLTLTIYHRTERYMNPLLVADMRLNTFPCRSVCRHVRRSVGHIFFALLLLSIRPRLDCRISGLVYMRPRISMRSCWSVGRLVGPSRKHFAFF